MTEKNPWFPALAGLGVLLAAGLIVSSFVLGGYFKTLRGDPQKITVKGLAEKDVRADRAEWSVRVEVRGENFAQTLKKLREARPQLDAFLEQQGFARTSIKEGEEKISPYMEEEYVEGHYRSVQKGFQGQQALWVLSQDLPRIAQAHREIIQWIAEGKPIAYSAPQYLLNDLESIKMSLIGAATQNARQRAEEFAKVGQVQVGAMRSASQGAFYILPQDASMDSDDYGGRYDKSTVDKKARVVVTIEYGIQ